MAHLGLFKIEDFEKIATRRSHSVFAEDYEKNIQTIETQLNGASVAIIGAAGSIGSAVAKLVSQFKLSRLVLFDISENNLVEVVRDLRSSLNSKIPDSFETLPIAIESSEFSHYMSSSKPFDFILNFSALKHVRSERNIFCLKRMLETNVIAFHELCESLPQTTKSVFSVSSDKSVNPANLMGSSKNLMERILWCQSERFQTSSTRFANVSFSDGSLLHGFLNRLAKRQPLSAPSDVKRYFISHREAGELSMLAAFCSKNREVFVPAARLKMEERTFSDIAIDLLKKMGFEPDLCNSDQEARERTEQIENKKWPCFFSKSDTSGEKNFEEFVNSSESVDSERFRSIDVLQDSFSADERQRVLEAIQNLKSTLNQTHSKTDVLKVIKSAVPSLDHVESDKNLDQKM